MNKKRASFFVFIVILIAGLLLAFALPASLGLAQTPELNIETWGVYETPAHTPIAVDLSTLPILSAIDSGSNHALALDAWGDVWTWGDNSQGQLGLGDLLERAEPVQLSMDASGGQFGNIRAIAAGGGHSLAVMQAGSRTYVYAWGANTYRQLGDGTTSRRELPVLVTVPGLEHVRTVAAGEAYSLALTEDGTVIAWGGTPSGETVLPLGLNDPGNPVVAIAAGDFHALALKSDGTVMAWGEMEFGQTDVPAGLSDVIAIDAGYQYSLALKSDGTLVGWGGAEDYTGQIQVPAGLSDVTAIAAGEDHNLALKSDRTVVAWGCGLSSSTSQCEAPAGLRGVKTIAAGGAHSLALWEEPPAWDITGDGVLNIEDISDFAAHWGESGLPGWIPADVNQDGFVNVLDVSILAAHWNESW